jgi:hypothetical protein
MADLVFSQVEQPDNGERPTNINNQSPMQAQGSDYLTNMTVKDLNILMCANLEIVQNQLSMNMMQNVRTYFTDFVKASISELRQEISDFKSEYEKTKAELEVVKSDLAKMKTVLTEHQRVLTTVDSDRRSANIIITGVPEHLPLRTAQGTSVVDDKEKVRSILTDISCGDVDLKNIQRLGNPAENHKRPIKATLLNPADRKTILNNSKKLKQAVNDQLHLVYIKKDMNPRDRKEMARLRDVYKREKQKPENVGRFVHLDYKHRKVLVDEQEIDHFHTQDF